MDWGVHCLSSTAFTYLQITAYKEMDSGVGNYEILFGGNVLKVTSKRCTVLTESIYILVQIILLGKMN